MVPYLSWRRLLLLGLGGLWAVAAWAADFRSVEPASGEAAILYDAPSSKAKKLYLIRRYTPVEVVVSLEAWVKVRDRDGGLCWIAKNELVERRTVQVTADTAQIHQSADANAPVAFSVAKGVALELVQVGPPGWAQVKHRDGTTGYVRDNQVWGL